MDRNLGKRQEMVADMLPWVAKVRHYRAAEHQLLGIQHVVGPVWALIVFSSYFFLVVLPDLRIFLSHTHPHTHTCTQIPRAYSAPNSRNHSRATSSSLYRLLYMEDFSYISLRFWICFIKREKLQFGSSNHCFISFFCSCYFIMTERVRIIIWRCHHEYYIR